MGEIIVCEIKSEEHKIFWWHGTSYMLWFGVILRLNVSQYWKWRLQTGISLNT